MIITKRTVSLLIAFAGIAIAIPAEGQTVPGGPSGPDKRLGTWEKQLVLPPPVFARLTWAERRLQPSGLRKLETMARALAPGIAAGDDFESLRTSTDLKVRATFPGLTAADVTEAAFIVMVMATKDMDEDIRMIMAEIKATNAAKQKIRELIKELDAWIAQEMSKPAGSGDIGDIRVSGSKKPAPLHRRVNLEAKASPAIHLDYLKTPIIPTLPPRTSGLPASGLKSLRDDLKSDLDGMNEMSEMTSLRLQMTMDRRSKFIQTLSNIMKKMSTTQDALVQNIK